MLSTVEDKIKNIFGEKFENMDVLVRESILNSFELPSEFLLKHKDIINWKIASQFQVLNEDIIRLMSDEVDWFWVSYKQPISESFVEEFFSFINKEALNINPNFVATTDDLKVC